MATEKMNISLSPWVVKVIIGDTNNKSGRIEELLIRAYMDEQKEKLKASISAQKDEHIEKVLGSEALKKLKQSGESGILSRVLAIPGHSEDDYRLSRAVFVNATGWG